MRRIVLLLAAMMAPMAAAQEELPVDLPALPELAAPEVPTVETAPITDALGEAADLLGDLDVGGLIEPLPLPIPIALPVPLPAFGGPIAPAVDAPTDPTGEASGAEVLEAPRREAPVLDEETPDPPQGGPAAVGAPPWIVPPLRIDGPAPPSFVAEPPDVAALAWRPPRTPGPDPGPAVTAIALAIAVFLAPLTRFYSRFHRGNVLRNELRARLFDMVRDRPGITVAQLAVEARVSRGAVVHHCQMLESHGLVVRRHEGLARRYSLPGMRPEAGEERPPTPAQQRVLDALLDGGPLTQSELASRLGVTIQAVSYHLRRLSREARVEPSSDPGDRLLVRYRVKDGDRSRHGSLVSPTVSPS